MMRERQPAGNRWVPIPNDVMAPLDRFELGRSAWQSGPVSVMSSLVIANLPDGSGVGPQWHISISTRGKRPKPHHVRRALRAFGMVGTEQDNHHPGVARHFWLPVDPRHRVDCECKATEITRTDPDGYQWQDAIDHCRGCELQALTGKRCEQHENEVT